MDRREWVKKHNQQRRIEMRAQIKEAILYMRANKITITKSSLAEEIGVSRQALNSDYVKEYLCNFSEFNRDLQTEVSSEAFESLKNENAALKSEKRELQEKNRQLKTKLALVEKQLAEANKRYEYLLGQYQLDVGNKVIQF